jgi:acetyl esterase/lipase
MTRSFPLNFWNSLRSRTLAMGIATRARVTPFYAHFSCLPPTLVHVGTREVLRDDSVTVVERMKAASVAADLKIFNGMCHDWQLYAPMLDEGITSIEEYAAFIKAHQA